MSSFVCERGIEKSTSQHDSSDGQFNVSQHNRYIQDVLQSMYNEQSEHVYAKFADAYVKYRRVVAEWIVDVAEYFHLHVTTTHAAIAYLDRLQPNEKFSRFEWQMMAICCLIISSKYNECEEHVPPLHKLEEITQQDMTNECVLNYELWILKRMGWKLNARTPMAFLESYLVLGRDIPAMNKSAQNCNKQDVNVISCSDDASDCKDTSNAATPLKDAKCCDLQDEDNSFYSPTFEKQVLSLATDCMLDGRFKSLKASAVACGILYHARATAGVTPIWRPELTAMCFHDPHTSQTVQRVVQLLAQINCNSVSNALLSTPTPVTPTGSKHDMHMVNNISDDNQKENVDTTEGTEVVSPDITVTKQSTSKGTPVSVTNLVEEDGF